MTEDSKLPPAVERARTMVHPFDKPPEADPEADTGELPLPVPQCPQGRDPRRCRWVHNARKGAEVCGDCGVCR